MKKTEKIKAQLLLVEDDPNLGQILQEYLILKGYAATLCSDGEEGWQAFQEASYDLCLLDVMMPQMDGFTLTKRIRALDTQTPILFLTAKSLKEDVLEGFKLGGDDYLTKPFSMEELLLRIQAILKRTQVSAPQAQRTIFQLRDYQFHYDEMKLMKGTHSQKLTAKEAELLKLLCLHQNEVLTRSEALKTIWGDDSYFNARSMDVYITKLRKLLAEDKEIKIINIHGTGFKLLV